MGDAFVLIRRGLFITFEGSDGSGKTTQAQRLHAHVMAQGRSCLLTREPGGPQGSESIRSLLKTHRDWTDLAQWFLCLAARHMHVQHTIRPALEEGTIVICDRFTDSTSVYQKVLCDDGRIPSDVFRHINLLAADDLEPDHTFLIDVPSDEAYARIQDRMEQDDHGLEKAELERLRLEFESLCRSHPERFRRINGHQSTDAVFSDIIESIKSIGL